MYSKAASSIPGMEDRYRFVIAGGPGSGKSTTINELFKLGHPVVTEAARVVIEHQQRRHRRFGHPPIVPWTDLYEFQRLVCKRQRYKEERLSWARIAFCDRGLVDNHGYCRNGGIPTPEDVMLQIEMQKYHHVYMLDMLPLYERDGQRWESPAEAHRLHDAMEWAYRETGHTYTKVPVMPPRERAVFIAEHALGLVQPTVSGVFIGKL